MRASLLVVATFLAACRGNAGSATARPPAFERGALTRVIVAQLERSAGDWNRGDLAAFLSDYAQESTTTFIDGRRARSGIDFIRGVYEPRFSGKVRRDSLHFEEIDARPLSPTLGLVTARFVLQRGPKITASGPFTLVMELRRDGWKILHDHSSSDPH
jgi:ketosteroid isomerase-like protein